MAGEETRSGTYEAGCHCGYIKFSVKLSPPLPEYEVLDCGCSMCAKSGYLLVCKSGQNIVTKGTSKETEQLSQTPTVKT